MRGINICCGNGNAPIELTFHIRLTVQFLLTRSFLWVPFQEMPHVKIVQQEPRTILIIDQLQDRESPFSIWIPDIPGRLHRTGLFAAQITGTWTDVYVLRFCVNEISKLRLWCSLSVHRTCRYREAGAAIHSEILVHSLISRACTINEVYQLFNLHGNFGRGASGASNTTTPMQLKWMHNCALLWHVFASFERDSHETWMCAQCQKWIFWMIFAIFELNGQKYGTELNKRTRHFPACPSSPNHLLADGAEKSPHHATLDSICAYLKWHETIYSRLIVCHANRVERMQFYSRAFSTEFIIFERTRAPNWFAISPKIDKTKYPIRNPFPHRRPNHCSLFWFIIIFLCLWASACACDCE